MRKKSDLHPYQIETITAMYERDKLLGIVPMGGGKTVSSLTAVQELQRDGHIRAATVMAPKRVARDTWPAEVLEWEHLQGMQVVHVNGTPTQRERKLMDQADVWVIGIDNTQWLTELLEDLHPDDPRFDRLIIDEITRYKAWNGKRGRALNMLARDIDLNERFRGIWELTGTPVPDNEEALWMPMRIMHGPALWPEQFLEWRMKYFIPEDPYTQFVWNLREEWRDKIWGDVASCSIAIDEDRLPPQPELHPDVKYVDLPRNVRQMYNTMLRDLVAVHGDAILFAENMAVAHGKVDQFVQGFAYEVDRATSARDVHFIHDAKLEALRELIASLDGEQAMIGYWYREDFIRLSREIPRLLGIGSQFSERAEQEAMEAWNKGEIQFLAVHPASGGHGLNLQKSHCGHIIEYCIPWSAEKTDQWVKRVARQGNKRRRVIRHQIVARDTVDEIKIMRKATKAERQLAFRKHIQERGL